ncbi:hypothetical protein Pelo_9361 [Pelomyxa schiedti]|nr:hypothetical protein Pelo_9361 [Pelomyxa schiedti]
MSDEDWSLVPSAKEERAKVRRVAKKREREIKKAVAEKYNPDPNADTVEHLLKQEATNYVKKITKEKAQKALKVKKPKKKSLEGLTEIEKIYRMGAKQMPEMKVEVEEKPKKKQTKKTAAVEEEEEEEEEITLEEACQMISLPTVRKKINVADSSYPELYEERLYRVAELLELQLARAQPDQAELVFLPSEVGIPSTLLPGDVQLCIKNWIRGFPTDRLLLFTLRAIDELLHPEEQMVQTHGRGLQALLQLLLFSAPMCFASSVTATREAVTGELGAMIWAFGQSSPFDAAGLFLQFLLPYFDDNDEMSAFLEHITATLPSTSQQSSHDIHPVVANWVAEGLTALVHMKINNTLSAQLRPHYTPFIKALLSSVIPPPVFGVLLTLCVSPESSDVLPSLIKIINKQRNLSSWKECFMTHRVETFKIFELLHGNNKVNQQTLADFVVSAEAFYLTNQEAIAPHESEIIRKWKPQSSEESTSATTTTSCSETSTHDLTSATTPTHSSTGSHASGNSTSCLFAFLPLLLLLCGIIAALYLHPPLRIYLPQKPNWL